MSQGFNYKEMRSTGELIKFTFQDFSLIVIFITNEKELIIRFLVKIRQKIFKIVGCIGHWLFNRFKNAI